MSQVYAVIMAGGSGTRFWPASRMNRPKQLLPLAGGTGRALLVDTASRLSPLVPLERVIVVTGTHLAEATSAALPALPKANVLCEPAPRNTAPCIAWATATIARTDPDAVVAVFPADHFIENEAEFRKVLERAIDSARQGRVTTVGIVPTRPETGYGYIEVGDALEGGAKAGVRFCEKPDRARAEGFVAGGKHLWNAGMFFFRVRDMMDLVAKHLPALSEGVARIDLAARSGTEAESATLKDVFPTLPSISIDHGVMEKAERFAVVPGDFGWNDVGSWQSAWELAARDASGNAVDAGSLAIDGKNNLVRSLSKTKKAIALVGVSDLVVVETDDAVLVMPRDRAQDVRLVIDALKNAGRSTLL